MDTHNSADYEKEKESLVDKSSLLSAKIQPPNSLAEDEKAVLAAVAINGNHRQNARDEKQARGSALRQVLAAFVAQLGTINTGMVFGFSAIAIPQLRQENSTIPIDVNEASWIASMSSIGTPIGCFLSGYMMDALGRKRSLIITEVPALLVSRTCSAEASTSSNFLDRGKNLLLFPIFMFCREG